MIDSGSVKARVSAFDEENGNDAIVIGHMLLFSNGAMREINPLGPLIDPPPEEYERQCKVAQYWAERVQRAREKFDELKEHYMVHAKGALEEPFVPAPVEDPEEAEKSLRDLRDEVKRCQSKLDEAREKMDASAPYSRRGSQRLVLENRSAAARKGNRELLSVVSKINI